MPRLSCQTYKLIKARERDRERESERERENTQCIFITTRSTIPNEPLSTLLLLYLYIYVYINYVALYAYSSFIRVCVLAFIYILHTVRAHAHNVLANMHACKQPYIHTNKQTHTHTHTQRTSERGTGRERERERERDTDRREL